MQYNIVLIGGTFDHFHAGHVAFLRFALAQSQHVMLGLTSDAYVSSQKKESGIEEYRIRKRALRSFLSKNNVLERVTISPIDTFFYPKDWENIDLEAIVVSENTKKGAELVNRKRKEQNLFPLPIVSMPLVRKQAVISSSAIRNGLMDREGNLYLPSSVCKQDLVLPATLRKTFHKPIGTLLSGDRENFTGLNPSTTITVGDMVTKKANALKVGQFLSVVDFLVERKPMFHSFQELGFLGSEKIITIHNPPGRITSEVLKHICTQFSFRAGARVVYKIIGEEDLVVLPLILAAPLGFTILYGQPGDGIIRVYITEKIKQKAYILLQKLEENTNKY